MREVDEATTRRAIGQLFSGRGDGPPHIMRSPVVSRMMIGTLGGGIQKDKKGTWTSMDARGRALRNRRDVFGGVSSCSANVVI